MGLFATVYDTYINAKKINIWKQDTILSSPRECVLGILFGPQHGALVKGYSVSESFNSLLFLRFDYYEFLENMLPALHVVFIPV